MHYTDTSTVRKVVAPPAHDWRSALKRQIVDAYSYGELSQVAAITLIRAFQLGSA
jgi:hypothetical protein